MKSNATLTLLRSSAIETSMTDLLAVVAAVVVAVVDAAAADAVEHNFRALRSFVETKAQCVGHVDNVEAQHETLYTSE